MDLFHTPTAGFDHPLEILSGCHERIRRNCRLIERIAAHLAAQGPDDEARQAAARVIRYFDTAGRDHHRDEEDDLFPALRQYAPSDELNAVRDLLFRLRADHEQLDSAWAAMHARLDALREGRESGLTAEDARRFGALYDRHIALEEARLLPLARRVLGAAVIRDLGERMSRRRIRPA